MRGRKPKYKEQISRLPPEELFSPASAAALLVDDKGERRNLRAALQKKAKLSGVQSEGRVQVPGQPVTEAWYGRTWQAMYERE